jgi:hypothetical protein
MEKRENKYRDEEHFFVAFVKDFFDCRKRKEGGKKKKKKEKEKERIVV